MYNSISNLPSDFFHFISTTVLFFAVTEQYKHQILFFPYPIRMDESRLLLSRKLPISSSQMNPYRMIIIMRLVVLGFFFHYRILHPVNNAYALWLVSIMCEIWFAISWILDQFPKWLPVDRETYLDRLSLRFVANDLCVSLSCMATLVLVLQYSLDQHHILCYFLLECTLLNFYSDPIIVIQV